MGHGYWKASAWDDYKTRKGIKNNSTVKDIYTAKSIKRSLDPKGTGYRESCDSVEHPNSTAIIVALDVTGSMGFLAVEIAKESLNTLITEVYKKQPIKDPQIMIMAVGDAFCDNAPLQVSQFESDIRIAEQLTELYFEGGGGGNNGESYLLTWYYAARHTKIDCYEKRKKKGFLFTIGDECNHGVLTKEQVKMFIGDDIETDLSAEELLLEVSRQYEVFHLVVGNYRIHHSLESWKVYLGERALEVTDYTKIPEIIESTLEVMDGRDVSGTIKQWNLDTSIVVQKAINGLSANKETGELIEF